MKPILFFVFVFSYTIIFSKTVDISSAKKVANAQILISGNERNYSLKNIFTVNSSENLFFYVIIQYKLFLFFQLFFFSKFPF